MGSGRLNLRAKTSTLSFLFRKLWGVGLTESEATLTHWPHSGAFQIGHLRSSYENKYSMQCNVLLSMHILRRSWALCSTCRCPAKFVLTWLLICSVTLLIPLWWIVDLLVCFLSGFACRRDNKNQFSALNVIPVVLPFRHSASTKLELLSLARWASCNNTYVYIQYPCIGIWRTHYVENIRRLGQADTIPEDEASILKGVKSHIFDFPKKTIHGAETERHFAIPG